MKNLNTFKLLSDYESEKSGGVLNTPNVSFVEEDNSVRYLLENKIPGNFENGYEWVDLGLPSGLKWATCNVGASNPQDYGLYFAWGETTGYTADQVTAGERAFNYTTYDAGSAVSISTNLSIDAGNDAAYVNMGGNWRMPTKAEFEELINSSYTTQTWTDDYNGTGVKGRIITSKTNSNSIFLPAVGSCNGSSVGNQGSDGYYWSASWKAPDLAWKASGAWYLKFNSGYINTSNGGRCYGYSVRGVFK